MRALRPSRQSSRIRADASLRFRGWRSRSYQFVLKNEGGTEVKRRYRPGELLKVKEVEDRVADVVKEAKEVHKKKTKVTKEQKQIDYKEPENQPKSKKIESNKKRSPEGAARRASEVVTVVGKEEEHVKIKKFKESRFKDGVLQYLVAWQGYDASHDEWISGRELQKDLSADAFGGFKKDLMKLKKAGGVKK